MAPIAAHDVKLIAHRWAMHALQALAQRNAELLTRVFTEITTLPAAAIDTQVVTFGHGAPHQFHDYGFVDASASGYHNGSVLLDRVVHGDTLLLLALRRHDPDSAHALLTCHASLEVANAAGERPIDVLFDAFAAFQLHTRDRQHDPSSDPRPPRETTPVGAALAPLVALERSYARVFSLVRDRLDAHHAQIRSSVETELKRIYTQRAPERLAKLDAQLTEFEFREMTLLHGVVRKYKDA